MTENSKRKIPPTEGRRSHRNKLLEGLRGQGTYSAPIRCDDGIDPGREDRQMLLYVQTWLPLLTITLTAAIFFSVASFIMGHAKA